LEKTSRNYNISYRNFLLLITLTGFSCKNGDVTTQNVEPILIDTDHLAIAKAGVENDDPLYRAAFAQLVEDAEVALKSGPYSVTDKQKVAPSGDKHDYASYSRYWWPDPNKSDGLPYIRRDGETYPNSQSPKESDRPRIGEFGVNTEILGLAYYITGEEKYAQKAAELIRVWFLDSLTYMNPNVNHAQCRLGHNNGTKSGVLDGRLMIRALEGSLLISKSAELTDDEYKMLKAWAGEYFKWLTTNEMALQEAVAENNHGSFYDVQAMYFALYAEDRDAATEIAQSFTETRLLSQIRPDGSMPAEMARTRPLFYSIYNLHAMSLVAHLAEKVNVDLWKAEDENSRLRAGFDYLVPYVDEQNTWPKPTLGKADRMELLAILQMADRAYPDGNYMKMAEKLPADRRVTYPEYQRELLKTTI